MDYVGYNMITLGMTNSIFSVLVGLAARHVAREAIIGIAAILHIGLMVFLLVWIPARNLMAIFFVVSALWGICDAIWQTQCNCKYYQKEINPVYKAKYSVPYSFNQISQIILEVHMWHLSNTWV